MVEIKNKLNEFILSEDEDVKNFLENLRAMFRIEQIFVSLVDLSLVKVKDITFFTNSNKIMMLFKEIFKSNLRDIEGTTLITFDSFLGILSYQTNFEGLDDEIVATMISQKRKFDRINFVSRGKILEKKGIKENEQLSSIYEKYLLQENKQLSSIYDPLQENNLFGIHAYDLLPIYYFNTEESKTHAFLTPSFINYNPILQDTFLIFSYIGNNQCREFYTGKIINIINENIGVEKKYGCIGSHLEDIVNSFRTINRSPLGISGKIFEVDENFKNLILRQNEQKEKIKEAINKMYDSVLERNKSNIARIVAQDYSSAKRVSSLECDLIEFQKDTKRLFLEKRQNGTDGTENS